MTHKIYALGNYFVVEIVGTPEPLQDAKGNVQVWIEEDSPRQYRIESPLIGDRSILLSDMQDQAGTPYTQGTWDTFYQANSGFNPASGGSGAVDSVAGRTGDVVLDTADINTPNDGVSIHATNSKEWFNHMWSAAVLEGADITENGNGTVTLTASDVLLRNADLEDAELKTWSVAAGTTDAEYPALIDNDQNFIYVDYNAGTPIVGVTLDPTSINGRTQVPIWMVTRVGNTTHVVDLRGYSVDFPYLESRKSFFVDGFEHEQGGTVTTEIGTRNLNITLGAFYLTNKRIPHLAFNTSATDTFTYLSTADSGVTWTRTALQTQIDNLQYNNPATGLVTLANNKYGVHWVFIVLNSPDLLYVIYGQDEYATEADAEASTLPSILPPEVQAYSTGVLIAKVIIQKSAAVFAEIQTPFESKLTSTAASIHNALGGLNVGDYQHLTAAQLAKLIPILARPWKRVFYTYNMASAATYTWNGIAGIGAPGATVLFQRHRFNAFAGNGTTKEGVFMNFVLPTNYTAGNNIKITAITTSNVAGGNYVFTIGVAQPTAGGAFSDDTDSEFVENTTATALGWNFVADTYVFDGTNMSPGDPISIMIYRDAANAGDTENGDVYMNTILIEEI